MALSYLRQSPHLALPLKRAFSFRRGGKKNNQKNSALSPITEKSPVQEITSKRSSSTSASDVRNGEDAVPEGMMRIPDLFVSWAAQKPRVNRFYEEVKPEVEEWFKVYARTLFPSSLRVPKSLVRVLVSGWAAADFGMMK